MLRPATQMRPLSYALLFEKSESPTAKVDLLGEIYWDSVPIGARNADERHSRHGLQRLGGGARSL